MASFNSTSAVNAVGAEDDAAERLADVECGSFELLQNSSSLNAMKFYGQVRYGLLSPW